MGEVNIVKQCTELVMHLLLLSFKFVPFACSMKMNMGPLNIFPFTSSTIQAFFCRMCWRETVEESSFASWFPFAF